MGDILVLAIDYWVQKAPSMIHSTVAPYQFQARECHSLFGLYRVSTNERNAFERE